LIQKCHNTERCSQTLSLDPADADRLNLNDGLMSKLTTSNRAKVSDDDRTNDHPTNNLNELVSSIYATAFRNNRSYRNDSTPTIPRGSWRARSPTGSDRRQAQEQISRRCKTSSSSRAGQWPPWISTLSGAEPSPAPPANRIPSVRQRPPKIPDSQISRVRFQTLACPPCAFPWLGEV
jgi:hypothetical protein